MTSLAQSVRLSTCLRLARPRRRTVAVEINGPIIPQRGIKRSAFPPDPRYNRIAALAAEAQKEQEMREEAEYRSRGRSQSQSTDIQKSEESGITATPTNGEQSDENAVGYWPDLMVPEALMDAHDALEFAPSEKYPYGGRIVVRNDRSIFHADYAERGFDITKIAVTESDNQEDSAPPTTFLPISQDKQRKLLQFPMLYRIVTQQTGKGKMQRSYNMVIVGNGDGLVGLGEGKHLEPILSKQQAYGSAVRNMDYVERFEKRTIWTEVSTKLGATRVILRPRPVGFGLRCNPHIHQVLKAAGIRDISAKVWGSRSPINVIKATLRLLQAGHGATSMGDGIGGPGRKLHKGTGLRSKTDVERERGRKMIDLRT